MKDIAIGVDIGGSHVSCMAYDLKHNQILKDTLSRRSVDSGADSETILKAWSEAIEECIKYIDIKELIGIGFAMPGPFDYESGIAMFEGVQKFDSLNGINVKLEIKRRLKLSDKTNIRFMNDATCFAIGESWLGAAAGYHKAMALTLGTGFGSAFVVDGIPVDKGEGVADFGCIYHIPYRDAIADDYFSTRWFINEYKVKTGKTIHGVRELALNVTRDKAAQDIFHDFGKRLGEFLVQWVVDFKTECIVIGGNIALSLPIFYENMNDILEKYNCEIKMAELFEDAAIAGSARLLDDNFYSRINLSSNK